MSARALKRMTRDDRRSNLLAAAARVVAEHPSERLSFEALAAAAGVSSTLPYKYFTSAEDVALELYTSIVDDIDRRTDEILADDRPFDDKVRASVLLWCTLVERDDFLFVRLAEGANAAGLARAVHRRRERIVDVWAQQIGAAFAVEATSARLVAASIMATASAVIQRIFVDRLDREAVADLLVRLVRAQCEVAASADAPRIVRPGGGYSSSMSDQHGQDQQGDEHDREDEPEREAPIHPEGIDPDSPGGAALHPLDEAPDVEPNEPA